MLLIMGVRNLCVQRFLNLGRVTFQVHIMLVHPPRLLHRHARPVHVGRLVRPVSFRHNTHHPVVQTGNHWRGVVFISIRSRDRLIKLTRKIIYWYLLLASLQLPDTHTAPRHPSVLVRSSTWRNVTLVNGITSDHN